MKKTNMAMLLIASGGVFYRAGFQSNRVVYRLNALN